MSRKKAISSIAWSLCACAALVALLAGFVPQREGPEVRRRASTAVASLRPEDMPRPIMAQDGGWSVRREVSALHAASPKRATTTPARRPQQLLSFSDAGVGLNTEDGVKTVESDIMAAAFTPLPPFDDAVQAAALLAAWPHEREDSLTAEGRPIRWARLREDSSCAVSAKVLASALEKRMLAFFPRQSFDNQSALSLAQRYQPLVDAFSRRFGLSPALVYAIIHAESNFSPVLVSSRSAMGLMQLLPSTAGGEVHTFLHGHPTRLTLDELSNPEINIRYGTAYLHLLLNRHLGDIRDARSREYCAVASYNMGPNRFLRLFGEDREGAIAALNAMSPEQLLQTLLTTLPVGETRMFVAKVLHNREEFAVLGK